MRKKTYQFKFAKHKNNAKDTWSVIKEILNKSELKNEYPDYFKIDGKLVSDKLEIANQFNAHFCNIGINLAAQIQPTYITNSYKNYLKHPTAIEFSFIPVNNDVVSQIIDNLKPKSSCGSDGLSLKLLKTVKLELIESITITINQCLRTGIFSDKLKIAKVIPLFKKGDSPTSTLPTISKILERVIFNQL